MDGSLFPRRADYSNPKFPAPREFQDRAHFALREGLLAGHQRQLLVAPTGAGKTYIGLRIVHEALARGRSACFICDRTALINQTSARADDYGLTDHAIVQADHWRRDTSMPFQIASIQTIAARGYWPSADVLIIDEAHTQHSAWVEHIKDTRSAVVGLTATPCSKGLGLAFTNMVNAATMHELTVAGVLVPMRILTCVTPDMAGAATSGGEWTNKAAAEREVRIIGDVIAEWQKHGENRKTIAFGADIAYCEELVRGFLAAGISAATFTSETPDGERQKLLTEFSKHDSTIRVLVSVEALAKGFDVQDIGCVIDARPLRKSLSTAIQMWGRGLRSSKETGKVDCLLLDHSGNIRRFYDDFTDVFFNGFIGLDMAEKLDQAVRKDELGYDSAGCPKCSHKPFRRRCLACGYQKETVATMGSVAGEMHEIRIGKNVIASDSQDLWRQLCEYARTYSKPEKQAGRAWNLFREITGKKPSAHWHFDSTPGAPITHGTLNKIKSMNIAFAKSRHA